MPMRMPPPKSTDAGVLDIDVTAGATIDAVGINLSGGAGSSSFNVATGGADEKDLTLSVTGGGDSSLLLTSEGRERRCFN